MAGTLGTRPGLQGCRGGSDSAWGLGIAGDFHHLQWWARPAAGEARRWAAGRKQALVVGDRFLTQFPEALGALATQRGFGTAAGIQSPLRRLQWLGQSSRGRSVMLARQTRDVPD